MTTEVVHVPAAVVVASNRAAAGRVRRRRPGRSSWTGCGRWASRSATRSSYPTAPPVGEAIAAAVADGARVVLTTGGTGLTPTDRTPEADPGAARLRGARHRRGDPGLRRRQGRPDGRAVARHRRRHRHLPRGQPAGLARRREGRAGGARARSSSTPSSRSSGATIDRVAVIGWPATLAEGEVTVRPLRRTDARRGRPPARPTPTGCGRGTRPCRPAATSGRRRFRALVRRLDSLARAGVCMPFAVEVDGQFAGQVTVNNIVRGSAQFASVGYWLDRAYAGRGVMPLRRGDGRSTTASATAGLHRIEIAIRPENSNSLRVVEKLGLQRVRLRAALPAHRRRLARPPALRRHGRGVPGWDGATPARRRTQP